MSQPGTARYIRTLGLALRFAVELWVHKRLGHLRRSRQAKATSALYTRQARQFVRFAAQMGGLIIKVGQFLSVRIDLMPKEYIEVLSELRDAVPPVPTDQIVEVIEAELGQPLASVYTSFDREPVAAASLGQVHRARLPDGADVAVKVLRPGIEDLVETDLRSLRVLLRWLGRLTDLGRYTDLAGLEADFGATFSDELDYVKEAHSAEAFQRELLFNPHVDIPRIYWPQSTKRVLTMEYMAGVPIDDLATIDAWGLDRNKLAVSLAGLFFEMVIESGHYHADPHPGNVFVRQDGTIELIDFGMVGQVTPQARQEYTWLVAALVRRDAAGIVASMKSLGFLGPGADTRGLADLIAPYIDTLVGEVAGFYTGASFLDAMMDGSVQLSIDSEVLGQIQRFIYAQPINLPGQTTFLFKSLITVIGLCLVLDPELDMLATATPYVANKGSTFSMLTEAASKLLTNPVEAAAGLVPRVRRMGEMVTRLEDGSFEADFGAMLDARMEQHQRRQNRQFRRTVAVAGGLAALFLGLKRRQRSS
ncbi:MAG: AarF/UbiB family protein [Micrococcales bacterium]|nr:AarF/UbiB family protein [Micrococcales bacterium]